jgi:hypothetical protein
MAGPDIACRFLSHFVSSSAAPQALMILAAALVAAQPFFDVDRGLIGAFISVGRHSFGFQQRAGIEMNHALGMKSEAILADGGMPGIAAPEIFRRRFVNPVGDSLPQSRADIDVPARNAQRHLSASIFQSG